ncbi:hypothetical protein SASPL_152994 [Salvia splendens]|uniref:MYB-CC type transcription factor LHEQLE-containing domain-containing protein n=1 Tax=Salvia splendens TaxID=180675 RepID=A0A8X8W491_SALSN|nr:hypothetical protein SASPL_152994 [Salvia splendens]
MKVDAVFRGYSKISSEGDGAQGTHIVSLEEPFTGKLVTRYTNFLVILIDSSWVQKYRLGQQHSKQHNTDNFENPFIVSTSTNSLSMNIEQGEIPLVEAVRCQIEVQKTLEEQLEVQKKLQMRIEAQGRYLQAILKRAQQSLSANTNHSDSLESTKPQLTDFNLALSSFMHTVNGDSGNGDIIEDTKDVKIKLEGPSIEFDLNSRSGYDFIGITG